MESPRVVQFVLGNYGTHWRDLERLDESSIERDPGRFSGGRNSWIAQTYLRLRTALTAREWTVGVGPCFVPGAVAIAHRDDANDFAGRRHSSFLVVVRADRAPVAACDLAVAQNRIGLASHERFVPLWPQPGLRPRDATRGAVIRRIAYHGRTGSAPSWFFDGALRGPLERRGIEFRVERSRWEDYREVDVSIAAREETGAVLATKPATKVYNGWLARVPVLAAAEPAYREIRRSALDFIEVAAPGDVLRAVDLLRGNPRLFEAMVENGVKRGEEFSVEATRRRWLDLLEDEVGPAFDRSRTALASRGLWHWRAMATQKALSRVHRLRAGYERWADASGERAADHLADVAR